MSGLSVGVVGCGYWGSKHVRVLEGMSEVEQVVAIDGRQERLTTLQRTFPRLMTSTSLASALDLVDAVIIATPARTHAALARTAIAAGKSVMVEKPLATSSAEAQLLIEEAAMHGVTLMAGHTFLYNPAVWQLRDLVQSGELGRIFYLDAARLNLGLYQADINVLWDLAPHDISICNYVLGAEPDAVEAWGSTHAHHLEDVVYMRLLYSELGVIANIHVSWLDPCKVRRMTVVGSNKMAVYNDVSTQERLRIFDKGVVPSSDNLQEVPMSYRYGEIRSPFIDFQEPLTLEDRDFVGCALTGERPKADGENGLSVVKVLEAADLSLVEGRRVALDEIAAAPRRDLLPTAGA